MFSHCVRGESGPRLEEAFADGGQPGALAGAKSTLVQVGNDVFLFVQCVDVVS